jgi:hypothetical protein
MHRGGLDEICTHEPTDPWFGNQLALWLTNEAHPSLGAG